MGIISELKFLEKDKRFRQASGKFKEEFDFLVKLDKHAKTEIREVIKLTEKDELADAANKLTDLQKNFSKELLFLNQIEIFCRKNNLHKELNILLDAKKKLWKAMGALNHGGSKLVYRGQKKYVIKKFSEALAMF